MISSETMLAFPLGALQSAVRSKNLLRCRTSHDYLDSHASFDSICPYGATGASLGTLHNQCAYALSDTAADLLVFRAPCRAFPLEGEFYLRNAMTAAAVAPAPVTKPYLNPLQKLRLTCVCRTFLSATHAAA